MRDSRFYTRVLFVVLFAAILPAFGMILCTHLLPDWSCETVPLHSVIEFLGLFAGLSLAVFLLLLHQHRRDNSYYIIVASALIGMGILDAFHSAVPPRKLFCLALQYPGVDRRFFIFLGLGIRSHCRFPGGKDPAGRYRVFYDCHRIVHNHTCNDISGSNGQQ